MTGKSTALTTSAMTSTGSVAALPATTIAVAARAADAVAQTQTAPAAS